MAYTALYSASSIADVIIDAIVSLANGMVGQGGLLLAGSAIALTMAISLYLGLFGRFVSFIKGFLHRVGVR